MKKIKVFCGAYPKFKYLKAIALANTAQSIKFPEHSLNDKYSIPAAIRLKNIKEINKKINDPG